MAIGFEALREVQPSFAGLNHIPRKRFEVAEVSEIRRIVNLIDNARHIPISLTNVNVIHSAGLWVL